MIQIQEIIKLLDFSKWYYKSLIVYICLFLTMNENEYQIDEYQIDEYQIDEYQKCSKKHFIMILFNYDILKWN